MPDRNNNHSNSYQYVLNELCVSPFILGDLSSAQGMLYKMCPHDYEERLLDLKEKLTKRFWQLVEQLTDRQKQVMKLTCEGYTQNEIAKKLGINQTSVHKVIKGNIDYKNGKKRYGGAFKKLEKIIKSDVEIQKILKEMNELYESFDL